MQRPTLRNAVKPWLTNIRLVEVVWVAVLYIVFARIGQLFAVSPGNVTPVWIPSGVMLALALKLGVRIWPGVFLGAFLGNIWAYFNTETWTACFSAIASATLNGLGDVLSTVLAAQLIVHFTQSNRIFQNEKTLVSFLILGVITGPLISAIFGVGGLYWFGHIDQSAVNTTFLTWWIGDGAGVVIFTPFLLSWLHDEKFFDRSTIGTMCFSIPYSLIIAAIIFDLLQFPLHVEYAFYILMPLLFAILFRYGQRQVFSVQTVVLSLAVVATSNGLGPFVSGTQLSSLLLLQVFAAIFSFVLFVIALFNLEKSRNEEILEKRTIELEELYRKDSLTNLWNRYRIKEFLDLELSRFRRESRPFGVLLMDIDDFKNINDEFGHLKGDEILTQLAELIKSHIRDIDFLGRWGGEEFIIIASDSNAETLLTFAEKLNQLVAKHDFTSGIKITLSIGVTLVVKDDTELTLLDRADAGLYHSKRDGKNRSTLQ
jgi:diguanylate cyclase (GGDEF)-like protein